MDNEEPYAPTPYATRNNSFDPFTQRFDIFLQDGISPIDTSITDIDVLLRLSVYQAISQAAQLGAAAVLTAAIFLMTSSEKRRSSVFILNAISLLLVVLRGIFQLSTIQGPFYEWFRWKTQQYIDMGNARAVSACSEATSVLLTIAILSSLYVQVSIVCCNLSDARRYIINISNALVIATAVAMRLTLGILNIKYNIMMTDGNWHEFQMYGGFASAANITLVLAIAFSTVIFTAKLAFAIKARRSMGMKQFGPMQVIFVMGCQTMFTPRKYQKSHVDFNQQLISEQSSSPSSTTPASRTPMSSRSCQPSSPSPFRSPACGHPSTPRRSTSPIQIGAGIALSPSAPAAARTVATAW